MPYRRIFADIGELIKNAEKLVLDADATAGASTITVKSILGVSTNKILLFREPGNESAEIIATHAVTSPSGNTVTLVSTLVESHPAGTTIYIIPYNQVRFYHATTEVDANADDASLSALAAATAINPTTLRNFYDDTAQTTGYYYYRFIDSINSVNGIYSDGVPWNISLPAFAIDEVGYIMEFTRRKIGFEWGDKFSRQDALVEMNACLNFAQGKLKRWSQYLVADYALGQTARGVFDFALPDDVYNNETNKSILQVRLGGANNPLLPRDEKEFDNLMSGAKRTTVRTQPAIGATSLAVVNSYDFDDAGTVHIFTDNTDDAITYTGVTRSATAGILTGISASGSGSIAATHAVGLNVWQDHQEGEPRFFNVRQGRMRIWPLPNSTWINRNVIIDYNEEATQVDSESDTLDVERFDMVKHWLLWKAKSYIRNNGVDDLNDSDYKQFKEILVDAIKRTISGQKHKMTPKLNTISYRSSGKRDFFVE